MDELRQRLREKIEFLKQNRSEKESKKDSKKEKRQNKKREEKDKRAVQPSEKRPKIEELVVEEKQLISSPTPSVNDVISKYSLLFSSHVAFSLVRFELQRKWTQVFVPR